MGRESYGYGVPIVVNVGFVMNLAQVDCNVCHWFVSPLKGRPSKRENRRRGTG